MNKQNKCGGCARFISLTDAARCQKCDAYYHRRCVALPASGPIGKSWQCPECKKNLATDNGPDTPVRGSGSYISEAPETPLTDVRRSPSPPKNPSPNISATTQDITAEINSELKIFRDTLRSVNKDLQLFREEMAEIRASLNACYGQMNKLEDRVSALEKQERDPLAQTALGDAVEQLKQELNDRDQLLLANDVEIVNLPETGEENPIHTTLQIAVKLGVQMDGKDIVSAERVGPRRIVSTNAAGPEPRPRPLVVRLARQELRNQLLSSARMRRDATTADLGMTGPPRRFYVNERLTKLNRELFRKVRDVCLHHGWKFVWCRRGRILARNKEGDRAVNIRSEADITRIFSGSMQ